MMQLYVPVRKEVSEADCPSAAERVPNKLIAALKGKFRAKIRSWAFRLKWYVTRRCWAHNDTCVYCTKHGFCKRNKPGLLRIEGTWCCGDYEWSIDKTFQKYVVGKQITMKVDRVETLVKEEDR